MSTRAQRATIGVVLVAALSACSSDAALATRPPAPSDPPPNRSDASVSWSSDASINPSSDAGVGPSTPLFREDFGHLGYVESTSVAVVDVNHGWATLPALEFPLLGGEGVRTVSDSLSYNGLIEASSVVVDAAATVGASDSLELRASDTIHISGTIRAGSGGVRLVAGRAIYVDGTIETDGPIQLELTSPTGTLRISGRLVTLATEGRSSGGITMYARGQVELDGTIETGAARYGDSGSIAVTAYGAVVVQSDLAQLVAGTSLGGTGGSVELSSELRVQLALGRLSGGNLEVSASMRTGRAGHVTIEAPEVLLERAANLSGGGAPEGAGGKVSLRATGAIVVGRSVQLVGGGGRTGGNVELESATASVAGRLRAGSGEAEAGRVIIQNSSDTYVEREAQLAAGDGLCASGGDVVLLTAGDVYVASTDTELLGGRGGSSAGSTCLGDYPGGNVNVLAHAVFGPLEAVSVGGLGQPPGVLNQRLDPSFTREAPELLTHTSGWVVSVPLTRPEWVIGLAPVLTELRATVPDGTSAVVQLSDADADQTVWYSLAVGDRTGGADLALARRVRYRVLLIGRVLDAPVVDGFELSLGGP
jgi:hypothetical protein